ncbi:MAG: 5-formyltetrahydrofolate cyclo-ligase [Clostridiales bacterium]|nr:5-formyltetrahydrofolate cyclo-ligase [Clostridiales bacterium]
MMEKLQDESKAVLRERMRAMRRSLSAQQQEEAAQAVWEKIRAFESYQRANAVMAYMACRGEMRLAPVLEDILASGRALLLPRCEGPGVMTARRIRSMDELMGGAYGLMEPREDSEIADPSQIDLIFVPGTAFDPLGHRLGQGGGYYDRFLQKTDAVCAGICHDFALLDIVPHEAHDKKMEYVITPGGIIRAGSDTRHDRRT